MSATIAPHDLATGKTGLLANFARHVEVDAEGCWVWQGSVAGDGSPKARDGRQIVSVRRRLYETQRGAPLEDGLVASNTCGKLLCIHPAHVKVKTLSDIHRRDRCKRDHDISSPESRVGGGNGPCKQCVAIRGRKGAEE